MARLHFHSLPEDVLYNILRTFTADAYAACKPSAGTRHNATFRAEPERYLKISITLSHINSRIRALAMRIPRLWNYVYFGMDATAMAACLVRAMNASLRIVIEVGKDEELGQDLFDALVSFTSQMQRVADRWQVIAVKVPVFTSPFMKWMLNSGRALRYPSLTDVILLQSDSNSLIDVETYDPSIEVVNWTNLGMHCFDWDTPFLQSIYCVNVFPRTTSSAYVESVAFRTDFQSRYMVPCLTFSNAANTNALFSVLTSLHLNTHAAHSIKLHFRDPVAFLRVTTLCIAVADSTVFDETDIEHTSTLSRLSFPQLVVFHLQLYSSTRPEDLFPMWRTSLNHVRKLILDGSEFNALNLAYVLDRQYVPNLQSLHFGGISHIEMPEPLKFPAGLQSVNFNSCNFSPDEFAILETIMDQLKGLPHSDASSFRSMHFHTQIFSPPGPPYQPPSIPAALLDSEIFHCTEGDYSLQPCGHSDTNTPE